MTSLPGRGADLVDGGVHGEDVVGQRALGAAHLALRGAEVDDERVDAGRLQHADRAALRRDVVDLRGEHQRRHQQHRRRASTVRRSAPDSSPSS